MPRGHGCGEVCESRMQKVVNCIDRGIRYVEPFLVTLAVGLILLDVYTFFEYAVPELVRRQGRPVALLHSLWSMCLLFNVLWNQLSCVLTSPGTTLDVNAEALQLAMNFDWRWCRKCNRGKPPLAHHCSVCNRCVLKMDHHCVWMANCIGFFNYRYFVLFLFYMWVGTLYSVAIYYLNVPILLRLDDPAWERQAFLPFTMFVLSSSVWVALSALLGWHIWLVVTGQGTIDYVDNTCRMEEARAAGRRWVNPYHLGAIANWQETFDVHGRWWWVAWLLPTRRRKLGNGYVLARMENVTVLERHGSAA